MQQLSNNLQTVLNELNKFKSTQDASIQTLEKSYNDELQEIRDMRQKLNTALDKLENTTLKELDAFRAALKTSLKKDIDNCSSLKDELQQLNEAVQELCNKSKQDLEFVASRKCLHKIQVSETFLKKIPVKAIGTMIFQADIGIEQYLCKQSSLGRIIDGMQSLTLKMKSDQVINVKRKSEYNVRMSSDKGQIYNIPGICTLPNGQVILLDRKVKLLDQHYNVSSHCDVSRHQIDICQVTSSEVAVTVNSAPISGVVQFISVINGQLVIGRKFELHHMVVGIAHHKGALYITSGTALYQYHMDGIINKRLYEDTGGSRAVSKCAVSPAGDRIYVTNLDQHKLITLTSDGFLISSFTDPELQRPYGVNVTPAGQVLVCGLGSKTVIQVDRDGKKKLATLISQKDELFQPFSICFNSNMNSIILGLNNVRIMALELH
ncbi:uncharacterized protein LOC127868057 [Dreissena polymorpha]|uniref:Uncharacterized protein n=1 Tax=Dreissena polymorpha TaxID=45954 RepID=A0A9D4RKD5_DREPO|nr:uncharacterized protein LOC127868057 [Dreissena polymorpha]KAH3869567.1 hypothetical protein DPMN_032736 [Dreissena polymorpha]